MSVVDLPAPSRSSEAAALWEAMASRGQVISPVPQVVGRLAIPEGFHDDLAALDVLNHEVVTIDSITDLASIREKVTEDEFHPLAHFFDRYASVLQDFQIIAERDIYDFSDGNFAAGLAAAMRKVRWEFGVKGPVWPSAGPSDTVEFDQDAPDTVYPHIDILPVEDVGFPELTVSYLTSIGAQTLHFPGVFPFSQTGTIDVDNVAPITLNDGDVARVLITSTHASAYGYDGNRIVGRAVFEQSAR